MDAARDIAKGDVRYRQHRQVMSMAMYDIADIAWRRRVLWGLGSQLCPVTSLAMSDDIARCR